ncbi:hypothetical protein NEOLEDRAFT_1068343 [Neolentinus lepideus HHB14362 ss-1]|uniref:Mitochondrial adapter protein MCP1 transmembrane domain-containing protein n=1 Tax=Neolentinus lepideus HHB14362 ss-1 TaxID=1314782 RepID=A0A165RM15_9AGAM|nr:hypothetical protein NEOLEDRAFT_1068343 [Neolentinus lepideus HHB14362 ss-1]
MSTPKPNAALPWLTRAAHGSSAFLAIFLAIHLSAPALANLGGASLASQVMLLGREYYQAPIGEPSLLLAPLALHAAASTAKRLLSPRPVRLLTLTGYATLLVFAPIHFITHRLNPSFAGAPIHAVGPAELDYEFVKVGLHAWPWRSALLYAGLVGCTVLHAAEGVNIILTTYFRKRWSAKTRRIAAALCAVPVLTGVLTLVMEPLMALSSVAARYHASFTRSYIFRL